MGASNTYIYDTQDNLASILPALLQNKGIDPTAAMAMMQNKGGLLGNNGLGDIIALIIVAAIFGNGNGGGLFGGGNNNNRNAETDLLMQTLNRNGVDINQLAQSVNLSTGQIQHAINSVATQISNLAGQQGLSTQQIINSLQAGNCQLSHQLADCCCKTQQVIAQGFSDLGYATRDQTCAIEKAIAASTSQIIEGQRNAEMRELNRDIAERDRRIAEQATAINNYQQTQTFAAMLQNATSPLAVGLQNLQSDVDGIKCRLPKTEVITAQPDYVPVNRGINVNYGIVPTCGYGYGYPYGFPFGGNNGNGSFF